jgi:hypothetical protein
MSMEIFESFNSPPTPESKPLVLTVSLFLIPSSNAINLIAVGEDSSIFKDVFGFHHCTKVF